MMELLTQEKLLAIIGEANVQEAAYQAAAEKMRRIRRHAEKALGDKAAMGAIRAQEEAVHG